MFVHVYEYKCTIVGKKYNNNNNKGWVYIQMFIIFSILIFT